MQSVSDRWYNLYNRVSVGFALLFLGGAAVTALVPSLQKYGHRLGLSYTLSTIAVIHLVYVVVVYRRLSQRYGLGPTTAVIALMNSLGILSLMQATGALASWYWPLWGLFVLVVGMFGTYAIVATVFMMSTYLVIISSTAFAEKYTLTIWAFASVIGTYVLALIGHVIWRRSYIDQESAQVAKLSGMLKNKQVQSEILIQSLADGIIVTNPDGKIGLINSVAASMLEWPADEAAGLDINLVAKLRTDADAEITHEDNPFTTAYANKASAHATLKLVGKNNKQTIVSIVASPIMVSGSDTPSGVVAVLRDVSVEHKEEKQRADFISTASHEMRTPVAAIEGYLALALNEKVSKIDPKARNFLEKAHESTQHLGKLFQDLLTSAKAEDGRLVSHPVVVEMGAYLEQLTDAFTFSAQKKGLLAEFIIGTTPSEGQDKIIRPLYYTSADPDRLREAITNLFDNAVKYTPSGKVSLGLTGNADVVQMFIRDTGPGIPKDDIPHLFQKFYRVDNSATRTIGGTGLGLFICRKIIELYHGRIWAESELGKGSTFYINLPRLSSQKALELQQVQSQDQAPAPITSLTTPVV